MAREVLFLLGEDGSILWSDASDSPTALPDSRRRWEKIWELRGRVREIAHSHPLGGAFFSNEDETTMEALQAALGADACPVFSVVAPEGMIRREQNQDSDVQDEPWWVPLMRLASGMNQRSLPDPRHGSEEDERER